MFFERTAQELKRIPVMPVLSYCAVVLLLAWILKQVTFLGNSAYIIVFIISPVFVSTINWFTEGSLMKALREDWMAISNYGHLLIILDCLIIFRFINEFKLFLLKEPWVRKPFYK